MTRWIALVLGAVLLVWPALMNGYPLTFVDTVSYLLHTIQWRHPWDKTAAYGPFLYAFHWGWTLWLPLAAQGLIASHLLWLAQRVATGGATPARHLAVTAALALLTTAPWFTAIMMPDALTPIVVIALYLLGFGEERLSRGERSWVTVIAAIAVAVHLSHLPTAAGLVLLAALLRRRARPVLRTALPVAMAVAFLLAANLIAFGRPVLSAHGSFFLLARLQADGPAVETLRDRCPSAGWYLCDYIHTMPMDSDHFLWSPESPPQVDRFGNRREMGGTLLTPEAREIVAATLRDRPFAVARAMAWNTLRQLVTTRLGDVLDNTDLQHSVQIGIRDQFGPRELARFNLGAQMRGDLERLAAPFIAVQGPVLVVALLAVLAWLPRRDAWRDPRRLGFVLFMLAGILGNAFATGALSAPHQRYGARIVWILPLAAMVAWMPRAAPASARGEALRRAAAAS